MPYEKISIDGYLGMAGSADPKDVKPGFAVFSKNLDMVREYGVFTALPEDIPQVDGSSPSYLAASEGQYIRFENGAGGEGMVWQSSAGTLRSSIDIETLTSSLVSTVVNAGNEGNSTLRATDKRFCGSSDGQAVHMGFGSGSANTYRPLWYGYFAHEQFGVNTTTSTAFMDIGFGASEAELKQPPIYGYVGDIGSNLDSVTVTYGNMIGVVGDLTIDNTQNNLNIGKKYKYYVSAIYDLAQEGPLKYVYQLNLMTAGIRFKCPQYELGVSPHKLVGAHWNDGAGNDTDSRDYTHALWQEVTSDTSMITPVSGINSVAFRLWCRVNDDTVDQYDNINRRITGFNVYRSEIFDGSEGTPFFLKTIDINDAAWVNPGGVDKGLEATATDTALYLDTGWYWYYPFVDDTFVTVDSYRDVSELPPDLTNMNLHYGLSTTTEGYHIVGDAWHEDLKSIEAWLFRSKKQRFDTFDWTNDYLVLPTRPSALASYGGRLYAFAPGRTYVVNVHTFDLEDTWEGIGCVDQRSVVVTDKGMFWCDKNSIYHHDGSHIQNIGEPVLTNIYLANIGYSYANFTTAPVATFDPRYDSFALHYYNGTDYMGLSYHISSRRWGTSTFSALTSGTISGIVGAYYLLNGTPVVVVNSSSTIPEALNLNAHATNRKAWTWVGYNINDGGHVDTYYRMHVFCIHAQPSTVSFFEDDPTYTYPLAATTIATDGVVTTYKINSTETPPPWNRVKSLSLLLGGTATTGTPKDVQHIALIHRRFSDR